MNIAEVLKKLRKEKHISLVELAQKSGVAIATLSRIENGKMTGTIQSHEKIAEALEIPLPELYKIATKKPLEVAKDKVGHVIGVQNKKFSSELLITDTHNKKLIPLIIKITKGAKTSTDATKVGVDKFVCLLKGRVEAHIGDETIGLSGNDSIYFDSSILHYFKNIGTGEARFVCIIAPPIL